MSQELFYTAAETAEKLNVGETAIKMWRKRYAKWSASEEAENASRISEDEFEILKTIADNTSKGIPPSEIAEILENLEKQTTKHHNQLEKQAVETEQIDEVPPPPLNGSGRKPFITGEEIKGQVFENNQSIISLLKLILEQQHRIADAVERRASAEERKAAALESRSEAELLKADIFQKALSSIKESSVKSTVSSLMERIKAMPGPEPDEMKPFSTGIDPDIPEDIDNLPELTETIEPDYPRTAEAEIPAGPVAQEKTEQPEPATEKRGRGISEEPQAIRVEEDMDDLSLLIEQTDIPAIDEDMDDLSLLVENSTGEPPQAMDDLSLLIEQVKIPAVDVDMDDLSLLIDSQAAKREEKKAPSEPKPDLKNTGDYKSQVLSRIIKMKEKEGLSVEETKKIFNDEGLKTLSGKGKWDSATIAGIYKYIDSSKGKER